jgi:hypothetical protein
MDYLLFGKSYFQPALTVPFADDGGGGRNGSITFGGPQGILSLPPPSFPAIFSKFYEFPSFHSLALAFPQVSLKKFFD